MPLMSRATFLRSSAAGLLGALTPTPARALSRPPDEALRHLTRADFLTQPVPGFRSGMTDYQHYGALRRAAVRDGARLASYTHVLFGPVLENGSHLTAEDPRGDFLNRPKETLAAALELYDDGLWPIWLVGLEDAPKAQRKHGLDGFVDAVRDALPSVKPILAKLIIGVEATEWIGQLLKVDKTSLKAFDALDDIGRAISRRHADLPIGIHLSGMLWGPPDRERTWLKHASRWCQELYFQYGFGHTPQQLTRITATFFPRIRRAGVEPIPGEYSLKGNTAHPVVLGLACLQGDHDHKGQYANGGPPFA